MRAAADRSHQRELGNAAQRKASLLHDDCRLSRDRRHAVPPPLKSMRCVSLGLSVRLASPRYLRTTCDPQISSDLPVRRSSLSDCIACSARHSSVSYSSLLSTNLTDVSCVRQNFQTSGVKANKFYWSETGSVVHCKKRRQDH